MKINLNDWDVELAQKEGKKIPQNIGQIKEIRRLTLIKCASAYFESPDEFRKLMQRYYGKV